MKPIKIIVVDDHKIIRDGIKAMLIGEKNVKLIGDTATGAAFLDKIEDCDPDIAIIDIVLPDISGIELTRQTLDKKPGIQVIILTVNTDEETINSAVKAGAKGFLPKDTSKNEFIETIKMVHKGNEYFGEAITKTVFSSFVKNLNAANNAHLLTKREIDIVKLLSDGLSFKEIGAKLFISARTVESHKNKILAKLELKNTIELVKWAIKNKVIEIN